MIRVHSEVTIYERNGEQTPLGSTDVLNISSHRIRNEFIVIWLQPGESYTVNAADLRRAIDNATNWRR